MISAKEMAMSVPPQKTDEFERTMTSIEKRKGFSSGYYYRTGKIEKETIEKLEQLGFTVIVTYRPYYGKASYYSTYVCWTDEAVAYNKTSAFNKIGYCTNEPEYVYEEIPERYNRRMA